MKLDSVNIRDPYILLSNGVYYLYGTRSATCWGKADGFDVYRSSDLDEWEGPFEIFHKPDDFEMDECYWAPECYEIDGNFYLFTTLASESIKKGIYVLKAKSPLGPFEVYSDRLTPDDWTCIDANLYQKNGKNYVIFSHSFEDGAYDGDMCVVEISSDLKKSLSEPVKIFNAVEAPWAKPIPFAKAEFGIDGDCYFTDGPCAVDKEDGRLSIYWSSWSNHGYAVGEAVSDSGDIYGPWRHVEEPFFPENGGHGMAFRKIDGEMVYTLHYPNDFYKEHPIFVSL